MTSIVITPFDPEHTEELKEFLWNVIEEADFTVCMPPSIRLEDVDAIKRQRDRFKSALDALLRNTIDRMLAEGYTLSDEEHAAYTEALAAFAAADKESA